MFIKMKRYLLSLLIVPLLLIGGYSSAYVESQVYTVSCSNYSCPGLQLQKGDSYGVLIKNTDNCVQLVLAVGPGKRQTVYPAYSLGQVVNYDSIITSNFNATAVASNDSCTLNFVLISPDPPLVPGGTANFTPVITGLTSSINEFIPYVVYIGLGVLGVLISFVAIKRLINWVRAKIFSSFK